MSQSGFQKSTKINQKGFEIGFFVPGLKERQVDFNGRLCAVYSDNEVYGREACKREDNGCCGQYFYSYYTAEDRMKGL